MSGTSRRIAAGRLVSVLAVTAMTGVLAGTGAVITHAPASAADACYDPLVKEINVSQGLPSYTNLVRGKTTLFKAFLSEKQSSSSTCAVLSSSSLYVTGGSVTVGNGTAATALSVPGGVSLASLPAYSTTTVNDLPGDPVLAIPGSKITSPVTTATTLSFTATLTYVAKDDKRGTVLQTGSLNLTTLPNSTTLITRPLAALSRPIRLLVVPLANADVATAPFPATAQTSLQNAMLAASRIEPVADGVGDIAGTTGGIRYAVAAGTINVGTHTELQPDGTYVSRNYTVNGLFCGGSSSFDYVRQKLSDFRLAWNAAHPAAPADRVLGVAWQDMSDGPTTNATSTCAEGYAAVNSPEAWTRLSEPTTGSPSGGVAALELDHTYGGVVNGIGYHSSATAADGTALGRAFNTTTLKQLPASKSSMRFGLSTWDNYSTLFEQRDWDFTLCMLVSTASPATECGSSTSGGTTAPASGGFQMS
jgi:hypothetical protein